MNTVTIEIQIKSGLWLRAMDCGTGSITVKKMMDKALQSRPDADKARAIDSKSKLLVDMAFQMSK